MFVEKCQYPEKLGGCEETVTVPVNWNGEVIGHLCQAHAMNLVLRQPSGE